MAPPPLVQIDVAVLRGIDIDLGGRDHCSPYTRCTRCWPFEPFATVRSRETRINSISFLIGILVMYISVFCVWLSVLSGGILNSKIQAATSAWAFCDLLPDFSADGGAGRRIESGCRSGVWSVPACHFT